MALIFAHIFRSLSASTLIGDLVLMGAVLWGFSLATICLENSLWETIFQWFSAILGDSRTSMVSLSTVRMERSMWSNNWTSKGYPVNSFVNSNEKLWGQLFEKHWKRCIEYRYIDRREWSPFSSLNEWVIKKNCKTVIKNHWFLKSTFSATVSVRLIWITKSRWDSQRDSQRDSRRDSHCKHIHRIELTMISKSTHLTSCSLVRSD